jgi:acetyl esterase/lipase
MKHIRSVALSLLVSISWTMADAVETTGFTPDTTITYKTVGGNQLQLHVFYPEGHSPSDRRPAIVFFFGGGWVNGSPSQFYPHCEYLASRGMVAMAADYRVSSRDNTTPRECVVDGKSAIRWIRQHAADLGIDPDRIAAGGGSAGGHVAAAAGTVDGFEEAGEDRNISARPDALVLFNPVFDNGPDGYGHDRVKDYWKAISPMHNIDSSTPPTVVFLGTKDKLIPVATAIAYKERMEAAGRRCDLHLYDGKEHGFFNYRNPDNYLQTVLEMDRFLASMGYLQGEPRVPVRDLPLEVSGLLFKDDFETDLSHWVPEQMPGGSTVVHHGKLEIEDAAACTVWFREKLAGPVLIEYDATLIDAGGPHDRVSDLNCFWMAVDPEHSDDIFADTSRTGVFSDYHALRLYYVGCGGHDNSKTRFRRYTGDGSRPLLPEHDLTDPQYLLVPNKTLKIQIVANGGSIQYFRDGKLFYDVEDPDPYTEGWFALRTVRDDMTVDNFRVYRLFIDKPAHPVAP